ncbi:MAG TPA: cob(I)yrinic acid a,c-diamide adenosyltransferase [Alphaproteobacteria bacterium]|nr:cob(I)yrinic acid a,c-diamide adenosyltransferase [Alphaproteobacteria bacterium]
MKIYTKTGDQGDTSLFAGGRVSKEAPRVEAYGTVDELNACLGMICAQLSDGEVLDCLRRIQMELFDVGSDLATPTAATTRKLIPRIRAEQTLRLEQWIDRYEKELSPLTRFILPSGSLAGATLHFARTVCRRAERRVVALSKVETINLELIRYLNRLSDLLFVLARLVNQRAQMPEIVWEPS